MRTVQRVVETLERRFLSPENVLYDFVGPTGDVLLPTPEETLAYLEQYDAAALDVRHLKNI